MVLASVCLLRYCSPIVSNSMSSIGKSTLSRAPRELLSMRGLQVAASSLSSNLASRLESEAPMTERWKPLCLYYTQGKCTKTDDPLHLAKFNHNCSKDLQVNSADLKCLRSQHLDYFLVLDLEGKVEILEFPVIIIDAKTLDVVDFFHRFSSPCENYTHPSSNRATIPKKKGNRKSQLMELTFYPHIVLKISLVFLRVITFGIDCTSGLKVLCSKDLKFFLPVLCYGSQAQIREEGWCVKSATGTQEKLVQTLNMDSLTKDIQRMLGRSS